MTDASNESLARVYDSLAPQYAVGAGINEFMTLPLVQHFCPPGAKSALEVCCGVGRNAIALSKRLESVWGIDLSHEMIAAARCKSEGIANPPNFVQGDLLGYDFGGRTFDYVYGAYFTSYFDLNALLQKLISLTRPKSRLFIFDGLVEPGMGSIRFTDILRQYRAYVRFMHRHGIPVDRYGWIRYRLSRHAFLDSNGWKRVGRWKREYNPAIPGVIWS